ncbi:hypothetical protein KIN20_007316 [Parelaphostrongylus tenuis]|uniref:Uncharacterized protein n=1 Tax=Parelaphostrongylus tenuis TaxID=148309 RepID=A0AAD5M374_PARTN|nr:hypothetical protein KIN20_007316 [Parelaphostrongylus tenuis]
MDALGRHDKLANIGVGLNESVANYARNDVKTCVIVGYTITTTMFHHYQWVGYAGMTCVAVKGMNYMPIDPLHFSISGTLTVRAVSIYPQQLFLVNKITCSDFMPHHGDWKGDVATVVNRVFRMIIPGPFGSHCPRQ